MRAAAFVMIWGLAACGLADTRDDPAAAAAALATCPVCHGVSGRGNPAVDAPRLAGLPGWYVRAQLLAFQQGWRGGHAQDVWGMEMRAIARDLDAAAIRAAAAYVEALPPLAAEPLETGDADTGALLYQQACADCHGAAAEGKPPLQAPPLAGQSPWYLARQLRLFSQGVRGFDAADTAGRMMADASTGLDAAAADDLAAYLAALSPPQ
ncbi:MAG: c-type cytochrome [Rhodothalassiaceae bacterium]